VGSAVELIDEAAEDPGADSAARAKVALGFTAFLPLLPSAAHLGRPGRRARYSLAETAAVIETSVARLRRGESFAGLLGWSDGRIVTIRDFLHARYVMDGIDIARI
jgi:hypothetical protein